MFTFKAGWRPGPDQTARVCSRVWVKTMLLWQSLISDGFSQAGWGCFPSWSSAVSVYLLWHPEMWEIKSGTKTIILGMTEVRSHARSQPWRVVSKSWHKHRHCVQALWKVYLCVSSAWFPASEYHVNSLLLPSMTEMNRKEFTLVCRCCNTKTLQLLTTKVGFPLWVE